MNREETAGFPPAADVELIMPFEPISCPYCNAFLVIPERVAAGQRVPCPRCGEMVQYRPADGNARELASSPSAAGLPAEPTGIRRSNRRIAAAILGIMSVMGGVALVFALKTVDFRRSRDPQTPLGYLPPDTNVVAGVLVSEALKEPAGQDFLKSFRLGPIDLSISDLEHWTGLERDEMRQIVVGLRIKDNRVPPRFTLVVQTHERYSLEGVRKKLGAHTEVHHGDKTLYRFRLDQGMFEAHLWPAAERILVVSLAAQDFDSVPRTPRPGLEHLSEPVQTLLTSPTGEGAHVWVVGQHEHWQQTSVVLLLGGLSSEDRDTLLNIQSLGLWLRFDAAVHYRASCQCSDRASAEALRDLLTRETAGAGHHVEIRRDAWVQVDGRTTPKALRDTISKASRLPFGLFGK